MAYKRKPNCNEGIILIYKSNNPTTKMSEEAAAAPVAPAAAPRPAASPALAVMPLLLVVDGEGRQSLLQGSLLPFSRADVDSPRPGKESRTRRCEREARRAEYLKTCPREDLLSFSPSPPTPNSQVLNSCNIILSLCK